MLGEMAGEAVTRSAFSQKPCGDSNPPLTKRKRNLPGTPDPDAEVIALSPKTLMATNRFLCEICGKGFQRDQNLQLHRRGHNLPWKLRQRSTKEPRKRVYVCPEKSCVHHHPSRALGDLTGIKKHFCRKHGEKKWKCEKCSKRYAVQSDWKAHSKTCGTREYRCDCGTLFSRRDSFITHRAFCDALAEETARVSAASNMNNQMGAGNVHFISSSIKPNMVQHFPSIFKPITNNNQAIDQSRGGLSLWMGQGPQDSETLSNNLSELHQIGPANSGAMYVDPFASCSSHQQTDYQLNWVYGSKLSSLNSGELTSTSLTSGNMKEAGSPHLVSAPSLYSTQHHHHHHPTPTDMSATALLQKAAQIGVTSSDSSFLGTFGMKCDNPHLQGVNRYNGIMGPNPIAPGFGHDLENSLNDLSASNQTQMYPSKRQNTRKDDQEGGQTRDFLGVGVQTLCPSSINGWI
ncbi:zinc finger protein MAGPIE-like [Magnolia sinica]|uniref:zinc finger protein MAGPIE-like n=1 Tax=Magnolia sinica TaxID=86752 RepID=UPI002659693F|nr:zinc finger protein MAGPIE-like [Magnolia sinica]